MEKITQLVIVCRDVQLNWDQFSNPIYVGVETGTLALLKNNLSVKFACGDFDSVDKKQWKEIKSAAEQQKFKIIKVKDVKDYLDSELAIIEALNLKLPFEQIVVVSDGQRWDMILAQLNFLRKYAHYQPILISNNNYLFALKGPVRHYFSSEQLRYKYISFFCLNDQAVQYNFKGCKYYPGQDIVINNKDVLAVSNEFDLQTKKTQPYVELKQGECIICLTVPQK